MLHKKSWFWVLLFLIIFLLSQDYLWKTWAVTLGVAGLPTWLGWFVLVHLAFIAVFYLFAKYFWQEPE